MIERKFISEELKELQIQEYIAKNLKGVGHSHTKVDRTPLGEKIIITASRPGLIVGRKGQNIKQLTKTLKKKFNLENPQIEINEVENIYLDPNIMAQKIADSLERFGTSKFKGVGHKVMTDVMNAGALGIEITMSGKIPSARAKTWRFYQGYLKKCGEPSLQAVRIAHAAAKLKTGIIGVKVSIMQPNYRMPDAITYKDQTPENVQNKPIETQSELPIPESKQEPIEQVKEEKPKKRTGKRKKKVVEGKNEPQDEGNQSNE